MMKVEQNTAALIKVTSKRPVGPFNLIMWMGYPDAVSWDGQSVNESLISIFTAKEYQYANSPVVYARGVANKIKGDCENASCFCTGACMINPPEELARDENYFTSKDNAMTAQQFNDKYPVGTPFTYFSIKGIPSTAKNVETTSEAWELGSGDAVVKVTGVSGGVSVEHLEAK